MTSSRDIKNQVRRLLEAPDLTFSPGDWPAQLEGLAPKALLRALLSGLCAPQPAQSWRAVGLLGLLAARLAQGDLEVLRESLRRLMWGLNEESGAILWAAPQAMGEILYQAPALAPEFGKILCSYLRPGASFLEYPPLQAGVAWAVGRLAGVALDLVRAAGGADLLIPLLDDSQAASRGSAAWALGMLAAHEAAAHLERLRDDQARLLILNQNRVVESTVGDLAARAWERCQAAGENSALP